MKKIGIIFALLLSLVACGKGSTSSEGSYKVALFVAGQLQGNPPLESLVKGLEEFKGELGTGFDLSILEAGYDQSEWDLKFKKMVSATRADLYITSNPSMLGIVKEMAEMYPDKHFLLFESSEINLPNVVTVDFKSEELAYLAGVYAGVFLSQKYPDIPPYVGILVGQEYPKMDAIVSQFREGFNSLGLLGKTSYRVLGNWYDAERARQIASQFYQSGVMSILTISGLANQGVVQSAREQEAYVMFYEDDPNDPALEQNFVVYSGFIDYKTLSYRLVKEAHDETLAWGTHQEHGVQDGILGFLSLNANLRANLASVQAELDQATSRLP